MTTADDKLVAGAVVQLKDMRTLQVRSFITLDDGQYHFSGLRIDIDYELTARSGEMTATKKLSLFDNRKAGGHELQARQEVNCRRHSSTFVTLLYWARIRGLRPDTYLRTRDGDRRYRRASQERLYGGGS